MATSYTSALADTDSALIDRIIDDVYARMLADYRINRFFNSKPLTEQTGALKTLVGSALSGTRINDCMDLLEHYFADSFGRDNAKPSLVTGNDFMFLLDVIGGEKERTPTAMCATHSFLLKLRPDDTHYDVLMEHLVAVLKQDNVSPDLGNRLLAMAENARDDVLGRGVLSA
ncbi:MAG: hypothetical protein KGZ80_13325 [Methylomonas sp.]|nr:hypothetical protein [Methylomonas sp.]PPD21032.1 MAG: hypothetical protein CTY23_06700 [Methylomonas sp.]PPD27059.1 MAG: hypothetical protein CTY22_03085 [Methylomonas sp.]PPD38992.1 MAG: hypothetical protein CTY21_03080 [Methylomonas sp.]PPD40888.1 MAG: hypothetical protein CTY17_05190 [Methylomonas sp.]